MNAQTNDISIPMLQYYCEQAYLPSHRNPGNPQAWADAQAWQQRLAAAQAGAGLATAQATAP